MSNSSDSFEPTKDEEQARRILSLAILFVNATHPLSADDIRMRIYPELAQDSFLRAFRRDCDRLAVCGINVQQTKLPTGDRAWRVDPQTSYSQPGLLSASEALELTAACQSLTCDPSFAYRDELRLALAKVNRSFADAQPFRVVPDQWQPTTSSSPDNTLNRLRQAYETRQAVEISYTDARGHAEKQQVAILGFFGLRGNTYLVAARYQKDAAGLGTVKTYKVSRIRAARPLARTPYQIPEDFVIEDYVRLPFQLGPQVCTASFRLDGKAPTELSPTAQRQGSWRRDSEGWVWQDVPVSSISDAAAWSIAENLQPTEPTVLVEAYRRQLEGVLHHGRA